MYCDQCLVELRGDVVSMRESAEIEAEYREAMRRLRSVRDMVRDSKIENLNRVELDEDAITDVGSNIGKLYGAAWAQVVRWEEFGLDEETKNQHTMEESMADMGESESKTRTEVPAFHFELIECPQCGSEQEATVEHTVPFFSYVHHCGQCGYIIGESEWKKVKENENEDQQVD